MRVPAYILLVAAGLVAAGSAQAFEPMARFGGTAPAPAGARQLSETPPTPYPMNYSEEIAQSLGIRNGRLDLFSVQPAQSGGFAPGVSGGVGGQGAMLKLQWHIGR